MGNHDKLLARIRQAYTEAQQSSLSGLALRNRVERVVYSELPESDEQLIDFLDTLISFEGGNYFWLPTVWVKRRNLYALEYMPYYEDWLQRHVIRWGTCDILCYRVLNPMIERYPNLFANVMDWADSPKTYVRRAAPVSLIQSRQSFAVRCAIDRVLMIAEKLKHDPELHVQKGVGWLLKYAYLTYPEQIHAYLKANVRNLPRTIFRYAVEKTPPETRKELMSL